MSAIARVPPPSYPRSRFAASSPLPAFLKLVTAVVVAILGAGGLGAYVWTIFLYPRILRTKAAKEVLESDQSARLEAVQRRLRLLVAIRGGMAAAAEPDDQETTLVIASGDKSDESSQSVEGGSLPMPNEKDLLADDSTALARIDSHSPGVIGQDLFALPETALLDLSGALPLLAPRPRPGGLLRSLSTASRAWTSAALSFSAKTPRAATYGNALSNSLERAGALGSGGAWGAGGAGGEGAGVSEALSLIGGLRGDIKGIKGGLLSRKAFPLRRGRVGGESTPPGSTPASSLAPTPSTTPPPA